MKSIMFPRYVFKLHSKELMSPDLKLTFKSAKDDDKVISISDSQVIRWIDMLNKKDRVFEKLDYDFRKSQLKKLKKQPNSDENREKIKEIYDILDKKQFIPELINVIMDKPKDIDKFVDGFSVNGERYYRFIGSPNQVKKSTVTYCSESMYDELSSRLECERALDYKIVPAKYEAYKALAMSGSFPVTNTTKILVVDDLVTQFEEDVIYLDNSETDEPTMTDKKAVINLTESDGYGLICPELAKVWSEDMHLDYVFSGCCVRHAFTKGMVAVFDFKEFARVHGKRYVVDIWGKTHDINSIEIILTASMLKLWSAYKNIDDFIEKTTRNGYTFSVTKITPKVLDEVRTLNYQYIQSYDLSDDDIHELISHTVNEIKDIMHYDYQKALLFLKGIKVTEENAATGDNDWIKALQICPDMINDPYVLNRIESLIKKKIQDAKIGIVKARGNYAIVVGDPYALCQWIFKLDVKNEDYGLLRSGEVYHQFWSKKDISEVVAFRSPMSIQNNIRKVNVVENNDMNYWYQYCPNLMLLNCHDSFCEALNGCDKDSDIVATFYDKVLINRHNALNTVMCVQNSGTKLLVTEDLLRESNKKAFGSQVGAITNRATGMYDIREKFPVDSKEYKVLTYRLSCCQLYQQG